MVGQTVLHYRILATLGKGGMGIVYKAEDRKLGRQVALKFLPDDLAEDSDALRRFLREARLASALNHPRICTVYAIEQHAGQQFIAMELLEGQTLKDRIGGRPLGAEKLVEYGVQIGEALEAAHGQGIAHRDIKPSNIFVNKADQIKVLDFGLAKPMRGDVTGESTATLASGWFTAGTLAYMAPEQLRGEPGDARSDIYSFGVVLYEMATGRRPFLEELVPRLIDEILNKPPAPPNRTVMALPVRLNEIILKCLEKTPLQRYQSVREVMVDLHRVSNTASDESPEGRLDGWKEIAAYLKREPRTVQRWEKKEGLPVHRHQHDRQGTVYAYKSELDGWWHQRRAGLEDEPEPAEVEEAMPAPVRAVEPASANLTTRILAPSRRDKVVLTVAIVALVAIAAWFACYWFCPPEVKPPAEKIMLAVLPFKNLTGDPEQDYVSRGFTEEMRLKLGGLKPNLSVIAGITMESPELAGLNVEDLGRRLNVQHVLDGSYRRVGDNIRVTAQLIQVIDQTNIWSESYDDERPLSEILTIQSDVAQKVANSLSPLFPAGPGRPGRRTEVNPRALEAYLRGRHAWNERAEDAFRRSMAYLQEAIRIDPDFSLAYAGLADQYIALGFYSVLPPREAYPKAKQAAQRALEGDTMLAEAHASLGAVAHDYDWDWAAAEQEFKQAIEMNPSYAVAHQWYAHHLVYMGRFEEALQQAEIARQLDPLGVMADSDMALQYYQRREYDKAIEHSRRIIRMAPDFPPAHMWMGAALLGKNEAEQAIAAFARARGTGNTFAIALLGMAYGRAGRRQDALNIVRELDELSRRRFVSAAYVSLVYIGMGEKEMAMNWMEKGYEERAPLLARLKVEPVVDPLRDHPRFKALVRRISLP